MPPYFVSLHRNWRNRPAQPPHSAPPLWPRRELANGLPFAGQNQDRDRRLGQKPMSSAIFAGNRTGWIRDFEPGFRGKEEMTLTLPHALSLPRLLFSGVRVGVLTWNPFPRLGTAARTQRRASHNSILEARNETPFQETGRSRTGSAINIRQCAPYGSRCRSPNNNSIQPK
jgi:hypothetical protein